MNSVYQTLSETKSKSKTGVFTACVVTYLLILTFSFSFAQPGNNPQVPLNPRTIAEYDSVAAVVMYWNPGSWSYDQIATAVVNGIQPRATVFLQTNGEQHQQNMINSFNAHGVPLENIVFIPVAGYRIWIRDHGPFSIYDDDQLAFVGFNDLATNHGDQDLPERLANHFGINYYDFSHIIFDGGNYLVDRHNRLFATDRLYTNNPGVPQSEINQILETYMGIEEIYTFQAMTNDYWGHIDMQIKLLNDTTFIISSVDSWHADHPILEANYAALQAIEHPEDKTYGIVQIPKAQNWKTYINSLVVNDAVLVPIYNDPRDAFALQTYQELMPDKVVIGIDCNAMINWEGAIHCITNQLPPFEAVTGDDTYNISFSITDAYGNSIDDAVFTFDGNAYPPGVYVFGDMPPGNYPFVITKDCYLDYTGEIAVTDEDLQVEVVLGNIPGDANNDGEINVIDLITVVQYFSNQHEGLFCFYNADVNQDGIINVMDIIGIVNIFTDQTVSKAAINRNSMIVMPERGSPVTGFRVHRSSGCTIARISFTVTEKNNYVLHLEKDGESIRKTNIPAWFTGEYTVPVDTDTLDPGTYMLRLTGNGTMLELKMQMD
ncbi:MAG: agmatine deiminase family protein [Bacteroidales bacterium]|nr:agmatine deiminase family protein [Bacteroidales bacterium]